MNFTNNIIFGNRKGVFDAASEVIDVTAGLYLEGVINKGLTINIENNIIAGTEDYAMVYEPPECGEYNYIKKNLAHSA